MRLLIAFALVLGLAGRRKRASAAAVVGAALARA